MSEFNAKKWAIKVYIWLSLAITAIIWSIFLINLWLGNGPIEETWTEEILKYVVLTPVIVGIVDGVAYPFIGVAASTKKAQSRNK